MLRAAVERKFEIIGEALRQIADHFPADVATLGRYRDFIKFRNVLIHGYSGIDNTIVWGVINSTLPDLRTRVTNLMDSFRDQ